MIASPDTPSIPIPEYEPAPYRFSGLAFADLPPLAQYYLADVVGVTSPAHATAKHLQDHRAILQCSFFRSLQGNDEWLVKEWIAIQEARSAVIRDSECAAAALQRESEEQFLDVLLPERERHFKEFIIKFDALVWLDVEGRREKEKMSEQEQRRYRDEECGLQQALEYTKKALQVLDREVARLLLSSASGPVKSYFDENVFSVIGAGSQKERLVEDNTPQIQKNLERPFRSPDFNRRRPARSQDSAAGHLTRAEAEVED
ncbi:hypothetical protein BDW22DRAFT_1486590 [Trametopsis cervina]|nr:hypothetical protein BDW22DRAFT_1486590 [Trametopsis cervina]